MVIANYISISSMPITEEKLNVIMNKFQTFNQIQSGDLVKYR